MQLDLQVGLRIALEGDVERSGTVVLPARLLLDIARQAPGPRLTLELRTEEQDVEVTAGSAVFHLRTLRGEDFPPLPEPTGVAFTERMTIYRNHGYFDAREYDLVAERVLAADLLEAQRLLRAFATAF